ncbi:hypothetical protein HWV62_40453 [Athelia sp. TMB]|nr:hypothetical protein HWV62_40453 [Athelia sp. TMB]
MEEETEVLDWGHDDDEQQYDSRQTENGTVDDVEEDAVSLGGDDEEPYYAYQATSQQEKAEERSVTPAKPPSAQSHQQQVPSQPPRSQGNNRDLQRENSSTSSKPTHIAQVQYSPHRSPKRRSQSFGKMTHSLPPKPVVSAVPYIQDTHPSSIIEATAMSVHRDKKNGKPHSSTDGGDLLPPDWEAKHPRTGGGVYYYNVRTHESTWSRPGDGAKSPAKDQERSRTLTGESRPRSADNSPVRHSEPLKQPYHPGRLEEPVVSQSSLTYGDRHYRPGDTSTPAVMEKRRDERYDISAKRSTTPPPRSPRTATDYLPRPPSPASRGRDESRGYRQTRKASPMAAGGDYGSSLRDSQSDRRLTPRVPSPSRTWVPPQESGTRNPVDRRPDSFHDHQRQRTEDENMTSLSHEYNEHRNSSVQKDADWSSAPTYLLWRTGSSRGGGRIPAIASYEACGVELCYAQMLPFRFPFLESFIAYLDAWTLIMDSLCSSPFPLFTIGHRSPPPHARQSRSSALRDGRNDEAAALPSQQRPSTTIRPKTRFDQPASAFTKASTRPEPYGAVADRTMGRNDQRESDSNHSHYAQSYMNSRDYDVRQSLIEDDSPPASILGHSRSPSPSSDVRATDQSRTKRTPLPPQSARFQQVFGSRKPDGIAPQPVAPPPRAPDLPIPSRSYNFDTNLPSGPRRQPQTGPTHDISDNFGARPPPSGPLTNRARRDDANYSSNEHMPRNDYRMDIDPPVTHPVKPAPLRIAADTSIRANSGMYADREQQRVEQGNAADAPRGPKAMINNSRITNISTQPPFSSSPTSPTGTFYPQHTSGGNLKFDRSPPRPVHGQGYHSYESAYPPPGARRGVPAGRAPDGGRSSMRGSGNSQDIGDQREYAPTRDNQPPTHTAQTHTGFLGSNNIPISHRRGPEMDAERSQAGASSRPRGRFGPPVATQVELGHHQRELRSSISQPSYEEVVTSPTHTTHRPTNPPRRQSAGDPGQSV